MSKAIKLGDIVKDSITGFTGVAVSYTTFLTNCPRWGIRARGLDKDGKSIHEAFDDVRVEFVEHSNITTLPPARPEVHVGLRDRVRCAISGAEGIVVAHALYIDGCSHVSVQPQGLKEDGSVKALVGVDEKDCEILESANPKPAQVKTGGPRTVAERSR